MNGVTRLDDGAADLNNGMIQFNQDGIQKLVDAFDGDVESMLDNLNEILEDPGKPITIFQAFPRI
ncbi:MAG: hypothetical protein V8R85_11010 [Frisingicoccus sp.]